MIKVTQQLFDRRVSDIVKELRYVSSKTFLRGLSLGDRARSALDFLVSVFPKSNDSSSHSLNEFGMHLYQGWRSEITARGESVGIRLFHQLEDQKRAKIVLASLDTGSDAYEFTPDDPIHFLGKLRTAKGNLGRKTKWITLSPDQTYYYSAREGTEYSSKAALFIETVLMPEIEADIDYKISQRFARIGAR